MIIWFNDEIDKIVAIYIIHMDDYLSKSNIVMVAIMLTITIIANQLYLHILSSSSSNLPTYAWIQHLHIGQVSSDLSMRIDTHVESEITMRQILIYITWQDDIKYITC